MFNLPKIPSKSLYPVSLRTGEIILLPIFEKLIITSISNRENDATFKVLLFLGRRNRNEGRQSRKFVSILPGCSGRIGSVPKSAKPGE